MFWLISQKNWKKLISRKMNRLAKILSNIFERWYLNNNCFLLILNESIKHFLYIYISTLYNNRLIQKVLIMLWSMVQQGILNHCDDSKRRLSVKVKSVKKKRLLTQWKYVLPVCFIPNLHNILGVSNVIYFLIIV